MDVLTIIYIVGAFLIGAIVTFILKKGVDPTAFQNQISELTTQNNGLKTKLEDAQKTIKLTEKQSSDKANEIKARYESLLKEADAQAKKLDQQLKNALNGKIDDSLRKDLAEAENLKKKIKKIEDELEEAEDDLSEAKKKLKIKEENLANLQDNLAKEQKESKRLSNELTSIKQQLQEKVQELNLKVGSLNFIQEILSAEEFGNENTKTLNKNIDFLESFIKGTFTDVNSFLFTTYKLYWGNKEGVPGFNAKKQYFHDAFDQWASTKRKSWLDGKTTIAFVGEFSAGKTSIVNRILSQDDSSVPKLPVSTKATTAIPTYIAGGLRADYSFISGDGKRKKILEDTFKKVSKEVLDQVKGVSSLIKYFVMEYKNPNLKGLSILDTPGFNSNDKEDRDRTIDVINECDALFWVFDVNAGTVNRSSISVIKEKLNKPLYVVINKVDTKSDSDVKKVEDLIKKTLSNEGLSVQQFIKFSSKAPLADIMNPIKSVTKTALRDTFVVDVREDIERLGKVLEGYVKASNESYNTARKEGDDITDQFIDCMRALQNDCETAYNIPQWVTHTFSKDRYEMNSYEGNRLKNLLNQIADDRIQSLATKFDERVEKAGEIQQEWSDLCDLKFAWQKVNECLEQYNKIVKNL